MPCRQSCVTTKRSYTVVVLRSTKFDLIFFSLPVDGEDGRDVTVETSGRNKKEAQVQCALEACRALDKLGVFRPSKRASQILGSDQRLRKGRTAAGRPHCQGVEGRREHE
ncbi:unnamed protein product [Nesidiocoris tenuis]|uniref:DRBM domain-containing protein n=1 Tax=Nesidiocoris tenuis TaxID=355587 RepID=A0A6H5HIU0_9HEMI|nr:unnamed protein product [Nesidiocoris tenuis]